MAEAEVGDDMSAEDPTVNRLEAMMAEMLGKEAAVYACSGTQSNQMGVRTHCQPGDELLIHETGHIANFEAGAPAALSGVTCRTLPGEFGCSTSISCTGKIRADNQHLCRTGSCAWRTQPTSAAAEAIRWSRSNASASGRTRTI